MILGNKCDLQESRVVDTERGRVVSHTDHRIVIEILGKNFSFLDILPVNF